MKNKTNWAMLACLIIICELAGAAGSVFTIQNIPTWYAALNKPFFNPPNWVFGPVWTALYAMMGISAYLVWEKGIKKIKVKEGLMFFALQLVLNVLWSFMFFGLKSPFFGLTAIILLWASIAACAVKFYDIRKEAAYLLLPYIAWTSFAAMLNFAIWILNP